MPGRRTQEGDGHSAAILGFVYPDRRFVSNQANPRLMCVLLHRALLVVGCAFRSVTLRFALV